MEEIIAVLAQRLDLTGEEIADILWLARLQWQSPVEMPAAETSTVVVEPRPKRSTVGRQLGESESFEPAASSETSTIPAAQLYSRRAQSRSKATEGIEGLPYPVPSAKALRNTRELLRSLRPLMQRVPSQTVWTLDEEATVQCIAETMLWLPQCKPDQEPWFDLALVIDSSPSMLIWQRHVVELQRLLAQIGAFRDVRIWSLGRNADQQVCLYPKLGTGFKNEAPHSPEELIDPAGRRLVLVVSDCISDLWRSHTITDALRVWAECGTMALVQMLPEWLWERTALAQIPKVRFHSLAPGTVNQKLSVVRRDRWHETTSRDTKVPVLILEPMVTGLWSQMVTGLWSQMVAGKENTGAPGLLFPASVSGGTGERTDLSAEQRVQRFRIFSSPTARRLAGLLAACPVVSLPIVHMVQDAMLPESQQEHVAEVLLSGLFSLITPINAATNPDEIEYEYQDDAVRQILLDSTPVPDTFKILTQWIRQRLNASLDDFLALLRFPQTDPESTARVRPFAEVAIDVLKRQGGHYARFAREIEQQLQSPPPEEDLLFDRTAFPPLQTFEFEEATIAYLSLPVWKEEVLSTLELWLKAYKRFDRSTVSNKSEAQKTCTDAFDRLRASLENQQIKDLINASLPSGGRIDGTQVVLSTPEPERLRQILVSLWTPQISLASLKGAIAHPHQTIAIPWSNAQEFYIRLADVAGILLDQRVQSRGKLPFADVVEILKVQSRGKPGKGQKRAQLTAKQAIERVAIGMTLLLIGQELLFDSSTTQALGYALLAQTMNELLSWGSASHAALQRFEFEVVTVNSGGVEVERRRGEAQYFAEALGSGVLLDMVAIPGGKFQMGSPEREGYASEKPQHPVTVQPFFMGKYPVTQAQWKAVAGMAQVNRELKPDPSRYKGDNRPVERVSWHEVVEFCDRLSRQTGRDYRLPSEAEWEYACRAGTTTPYHFGEKITPELAKYGSSDGTTPVGSFGVANAFGLFDMHGNVWEWCADRWHKNYEGAPADGSAWIEGKDSSFVLRGGSWDYDPDYCRSALRYRLNPDGQNLSFGFRVVCSASRALP